MRLRKLNWLATAALGVAVGIGAAIGPVAAAGNASAGKPASSKPSVRVSSFSGAYLAGRAAEADNDLDSAIAYYRQALAVSPDNQALQQSIMLALIAKGQFDAALPYAEKLKSVAEVERFSRVALAIDSLRKKDYVGAENWLKLALGSDLDKLIAGVMTAWAKAGAGDTDAAVAMLADFEGPEWYGLFLNIHRALILDQAGRKAQAGEVYEQTVVTRSAADVAPEAYVRAIESYAGFLARGGKKAEALKVLERVDEFAPMRPTTLALRKDIAAGKAVPPMIATPQDGAAEILLNIASALNRGGGEAFVRLYLQFAHTLAPRSDAILMQLGGIAEQQGQLDEAIGFYSSVSARSPLKRAAELQLGLDLAELKRTDEAVAHLKAAIAHDPDDMRGYLALGGVYSSSENYKAAAEVYDRAVARIKTPQRADWTIYYQRGIANERLKRWPKAEPNFRKALELFPNQPQVLNYLGYSWIDMNTNLEEGLEMIKKAVELRPSDGYIIDSLGWGYYKLGRFEEAVTELERAVALQPADPILNDHLGDAYWRVGRKLEAGFQWNHARDLKPDADVLAKVLDKLANGLADEAPKTLASLDTTAGGQLASADATSATQTAQAGAAGTYRVLPGQSLWSIAVERLGDGERFREILDLNPALGRNPNLIRPGMELRLP